MKKIFNVVCVTKRCSKEDGFHSPIYWHQNITGEIILDEEKNKLCFLNPSYLEIWFPVEYVRSGLDGMSYLIAIKVPAKIFGDPCDIWELYTDTPAEGSSATPEEIRENAKCTIARRH